MLKGIIAILAGALIGLGIVYGIWLCFPKHTMNRADIFNDCHIGSIEEEGNTINLYFNCPDGEQYKIPLGDTTDEEYTPL